MDREEAAAIWPVMKAYAEGKEVQFRGTGETEWMAAQSPTFIVGAEWRIAPEKREIRGWLNMYIGATHFHRTKEKADSDAGVGRIACVEVRGEYEVPSY